jgi:hypothetical protein
LVFTYKSKTLSKTDLFKKLKNLFILYRPKTNNMKKIVPLFLLLLPVLAIAQKNAVKVNLSSLTLRNYQITYERKLISKLSVNVSFRTMPKGSLPLESTLRSFFPEIFDNPDLDIGAFQIGNTAFTIEPRIYLSKKSLKGFYIAPYGRWASFDLTVPIKYTPPSSTTRNADFIGKITSFSGGVAFGTQFNIAKRIVLDVCWMGFHYGGSSGDLVLNTTLATQQERDALKNTINSNKEKAKPFKFELVNDQVTATGAVLRSSGPWAGIRPLSISLGFKF